MDDSFGAIGDSIPDARVFVEGVRLPPGARSATAAVGTNEAIPKENPPIYNEDLRARKIALPRRTDANQGRRTETDQGIADPPILG